MLYYYFVISYSSFGNIFVHCFGGGGIAVRKGLD